MTISVTCSNGHNLRAKDSLAGKTVRCPKCKAPIQIPASPAAEPVDDNPLGSSDDDPLGLGGLDPLAADPQVATPQTSDPLGSDPLGLGQMDAAADLGQAGLDPLAGPVGADPLASPLQPATQAGATPPGKPPSPGSTSGSKRWWIIGGSAGGVLVLAIILFFVFRSGDDSDEQTANRGNSGSKGESSQAKSQKKAPQGNKSQGKKGASANQGGKNNATAGQGRAGNQNAGNQNAGNQNAGNQNAGNQNAGNQNAGNQNGGNRNAGNNNAGKSNANSEKYKATTFDPKFLPLPPQGPMVACIPQLPTWAAAYDERQGRLGVLTIDQGLLVYDVHYLRAGKRGVIGNVPLVKPPNKICFKQYKNQGLFAVAEKDTPGISLIDSSTLKVVKTMNLFDRSSGEQIQSLSSSTNPQDPFLYYTAGTKQRRQGGRQHYGRVDFRTLKVIRSNDARFSASSAVSRDGSIFYGDRWSRLTEGWEKPALVTTLGSRGSPFVRPGPRGNVVLLGRQFASRHLAREFDADRSSGYPAVWLPGRQLIAELSNIHVAFRYEDGTGVAGVVNFPKDWHARIADPDLRDFVDAGKMKGTRFVNMFGDQRSSTVIVVANNRLAFVDLNKTRYKAPPSLRFNMPFPKTVVAGKTLTLRLTVAQEGARFAVLADELMPISKAADVKLVAGSSDGPRPRLSSSSKRAGSSKVPRLVLDVSFGPDDDGFYLKNDEFELEDLELPITIRIDKEVMQIVKIRSRDSRILVKRSDKNRKAHSVTAKIVVLASGAASNFQGSRDGGAMIPAIQGQALVWKPGTQDLGRRTLHLTSTFGNRTCHFYWDVIVKNNIMGN